LTSRLVRTKLFNNWPNSMLARWWR